MAKNTFINLLLTAAQERDDLFIITGDAGMGIWTSFAESRPDRFLNLGIAEQNTIGVAAGLAFAGFRVVVYNIIPFLLYRCFEQVRNDICLHNLPVTLCGIGTGITYAPAGMTHYALEDLALATALPNLTVISPADVHESRAAAHFALSATGPCYVRLGKKSEAILHGCDVELAAPISLMTSERPRFVFLTHGTIAEEVVGAARILNGDGIAANVVSVPMLQPFAEEALREAIGGADTLIVVEENYRHGGLFAAVTACMARWHARPGIHFCGLPHRALDEVRDRKGFREMFGLNAVGLVAYARQLITAREMLA